jgi:NADPH:quinone reductase-like Zn-dependent oxidoreductase/acyl carrier protein
LVHPVLLDAGFQAVLSVASQWTPALFAVVAVGELRWSGKSEAPVWAAGRVRLSGEGELTAELALASEKGEVLVDVRGLVCRAVDRRSTVDDGNQVRLFHRDGWEPGTWPAPTRAGGRPWALVGTARRFLAALADVLASGGVKVASMDSVTPEALAGCGTVVFAAEPDAADVASVEACDRLLIAAKAVKAAGSSLRVVTFGAHAVLAGESADPPQAALWGLSRVVMTEWPDLGCRVVDIGATPTTNMMFVASLVSAHGTEEEVALRGDDLYVRRLRRDESVATVPDRLVSGHDFAGAFTLRRGGDDALGYVASDRRAPGQGEIEVLVLAASVDGASNASDPTSLRRTGDPLRAESVTGSVLLVGPGVTGLREGDLVNVLAPGEIGSHVVATACLATRVLPQHSPAQATGYAPYFAAWHALCHVARLEPGDVLLVNGASTALGLAAARIGRLKGARVFATVPSGAPSDALLLSGVEAVEVADGLDGATNIRELAGRIDVVLNTLDGLARDRAMLALQPGGCFLDLAPMDSRGNSASAADIFRRASSRSLTYAALNLAELSVGRPERYAAVAREVLDALVTGRLALFEPKVVPARDVASLLTPGEAASLVLDLSDRDISVRESPAEKPLFRVDRSYLVTGGLTGFGLATAEWLVSEGARSVVLGSRRGKIDNESAPAIGRMREKGASVNVVTLDVTTRASVDSVLSNIRGTLPALAGIFHSVVVLDDKPAADVDRASLERVLRPKALGAWHLHEASRGLDLDYFVLYSSVSALVGNPNQASYAAANTFLDALASQRRALGLRGTSVSWGALGEVGLVARNAATEAHLRGLGYGAIPAANALSALKAVLLQDCDRVGIIDADWDSCMANFPSTPWNRLEHLREYSEAEPLARLRAELEPLAPGAREQLVRARVAEEAASILRADAVRLDVGVPLRDLGLDSLMAVELQLALQAAVGVSVPTIELVGGVSVTAIAQRTLDRLKASPKAA